MRDERGVDVEDSQAIVIDTDWSYEAVAARRSQFMAPSVATFTAYEQPLVLNRGEGQYLWDQTGKKYLDCLAQNLTISVGHNHPLVSSEARKQLDAMQHCTTMYYHPVPAHHAEELVARMPPGHDWVVHFTNSGAEAVDLAVLMARAHTRNFEIIALRSSFHGLHTSAMATTGMANCRQPVPVPGGVLHVSNPDQYRGMHGATVEPYVEEIERLIQSSTPGVIAGFMVEPIQGYGGVIPVPEGYLPAAFARARAAGGVCIVDEVQTGFARLGTNLFAFDDHDVVPDIVVLGKGISNGFPLSAVVAKREIAEAMAQRKFFNTYAANPVSCAAGRAVLRAIDDEGLQENARNVGHLMMRDLRALQQKYDIIGDVRGQGLMIGVDLVRDRRSKEPAVAETVRVFERTKELGLVVGKSGIHGNLLRISPPLCIQESDVEFFTEVLDASLAAL